MADSLDGTMERYIGDLLRNVKWVYIETFCA